MKAEKKFEKRLAQAACAWQSVPVKTKYNIIYHYGMDTTPRCAVFECGSRYTVNQAAAMFMCAHGGSYMVIEAITAQGP
jgi:hypothetical protein